MTEADFEHAIRRSQRLRIIAGRLETGDVAALRRFVRLTQEQFAEALGISVRTLQNWEQDRVKPEGPGLALLRISGQVGNVPTVFHSLRSRRPSTSTSVLDHRNEVTRCGGGNILRGLSSKDLVPTRCGSRMLNVRMAARVAGFAVVSHLALACSSDGAGGDAGGSLITGGAAGIYRLEASTANEAGCDAEGPSDLDSRQTKNVYMVNEMGGTQLFVQLAFCIDAEHCRMVHRLALEPSYSIDGYEFFKSPSGQFTDGFVTGADTVDGQCVGGTLWRHDLSMSGDSFQIESRRSLPPPFPRDPNTQCYNVSLRDDVESGTCLEYEVLRGTFAEPL